jgi:asparaginyl-tRNA synthetase
MKYLSIKEAIKKGKGNVDIRGWVYRERGSNKFKFIVLRDSSGIIQCVAKKENFSEKQWNELSSLTIESSIKITGKIKEDKRSPVGYEVEINKFNIIQKADAFPIAKDKGIEFLRDNRHLWLRSRRMTAIMKIRSTVFGAVHEYFRKNSFYEYQSPIFQSVQCEGGSTLFNVPYFKEKGVFLAQTWQLYAEPEIFALEKIYTIAPSFRAEKSQTSRHLTEYWHAEMEMAWASFNDILNHGEELIKHIIKKVIEKNSEELEILQRDIKKLKPSIKKKFPRISYDEVLKLLKEKKNMKIPWGKDLRTVEEDKLSELYDTPVIVYNYPKKVKAFYMKEDEKNPKVVHGADFIAPEGYGEIIGGSERESNEKKIIQRLKEEGENIKEYKFYLDTRKYGSVPHGGFGLGIERVIAWICKLDDIKESIPFPRTARRWTP